MLGERIGELVRARRKALGLSIRAITPDGLSHSTWHQIEQTGANTTLDKLERVAEALGATWEIHLRTDASADRAADRVALVDRLDRLVDYLDDRDVRHLSAQLAIYERERGDQGHNSR